MQLQPQTQPLAAPATPLRRRVVRAKRGAVVASPTGRNACTVFWRAPATHAIRRRSTARGVGPWLSRPLGFLLSKFASACQRMSLRRAQTSASAASGSCGSRWSGVMGQQRTHAPQQTALINQFIGAAAQRERHSQAKRLSCLHVDD